MKTPNAVTIIAKISILVVWVFVIVDMTNHNNRQRKENEIQKQVLLRRVDESHKRFPKDTVITEMYIRFHKEYGPTLLLNKQ